ncbi:DDE Tnp IS1595 domain-containing protein, partial [Aphis craccivora]
MLNVVKIYELFELKQRGPLSVPIIETLQSWGLIANVNTLKSNKGHFLLLCPNVNSIDGFVWRCRQTSIDKMKCDFQQSIRKFTFFSKSHLSVYQIVMFAYLWTEQVSLEFIRKQTDIARQTSVDWASFHREIVFDGMIIRHKKIGGEGKVVEIDESKFGKRKYHRGHRVEGQWVFGGVERETGRCFLVPVECRDKDTLLAAITDWILPGTTIISDCWKSYDCLKDNGYQHLTVNHSIQFKNPETGAHTNNVEGMWRHAKASMTQYSKKSTSMQHTLESGARKFAMSY